MRRKLRALRDSLIFLGVALAVPAQAQQQVIHPLGAFEFAATANGILLAAPHGSFDANTATLALLAASELGSGYLLARGFTVDKTRINVNRPTEGAFLPCAQEIRSERAQDVYAKYSKLAKEAAAGKPLRLYIDIHGNANPRSARQIEVATFGLSTAQAQSIQQQYPAMLAHARKSVPAYPELALLIEPLDRIYFSASCTKQLGILSTDTAARGLHFEFPREARERGNLPASASLVADIVREVLRASGP